jgi:hypothetical protein
MSEGGPVLNDLPALVPRFFLISNGCNGRESGNHSCLVETIRDALYSISAVSKDSYARDPVQKIKSFSAFFDGWKIAIGLSLDRDQSCSCMPTCGVGFLSHMDLKLWFWLGDWNRCVILKKIRFRPS